VDISTNDLDMIVKGSRRPRIILMCLPWGYRALPNRPHSGVLCVLLSSTAQNDIDIVPEFVADNCQLWLKKVGTMLTTLFTVNVSKPYSVSESSASRSPPDARTIGAACDLPSPHHLTQP
jgi:hypothetical protein